VRRRPHAASQRGPQQRSSGWPRRSAARRRLASITFECPSAGLSDPDAASSGLRSRAAAFPAGKTGRRKAREEKLDAATTAIREALVVRVGASAFGTIISLTGSRLALSGSRRLPASFFVTKTSAGIGVASRQGIGSNYRLRTQSQAHNQRVLPALFSARCNTAVGSHP
jgi:hypothetical protein